MRRIIIDIPDEIEHYRLNNIYHKDETYYLIYYGPNQKGVKILVTIDFINFYEDSSSVSELTKIIAEGPLNYMKLGSSHKRLYTINNKMYITYSYANFIDEFIDKIDIRENIEEEGWE